MYGIEQMIYPNLSMGSSMGGRREVLLADAFALLVCNPGPLWAFPLRANQSVAFVRIGNSGPDRVTECDSERCLS
jgi:hypothetical protein